MTAEIHQLKIYERCQIESFFHCKECLAELPEDESPRNYQRIQAGWTKQGLEVWCVRHELKIIHVDFEDQKHNTI